MMFGRTKTKEVVQIDIGKIIAKIHLKNGTNFDLIENGYYFNGWKRYADEELFIKRRIRNNVLIADNCLYPLSSIDKITYTIESYNIY